MSAIDLLGLRFLLASGGCLAAGMGVWALTALCRRLADSSAHRSLWLLGQLTVAAVFLVILLPHSERLRLVPAIDIDSTTAFAPVPVAAAAGPLAGAAPAVQKPQDPARAMLANAARAWLLIYLAGLGHALIALLRARRMLHCLAAAGSPAPALPHAPGLAVIEVDAPISPMLFGLLRPRLLLPQHLRSFASAQQQLIVEHELTHWRRRDLQWMCAGIVLQTLFWFNPFMRMLRENLSWAQELGCDREVLRGRSRSERKDYAAALVAQLTLQRHAASASLAFGGVSPSSLSERIALIRTPAAPARGRWARLAAIGGMAGVVMGSLAFQPALARHDEAAQLFACTEMADADSGQRLADEGRCDERVTPASTFNIVVSLMGYDSGILRDEHAPALSFKPGYAGDIPSWRAETDPTSWLKNSVLWYAQQVTAQLGEARLQSYVTRFGYGNRDVSGDPGKDNGLTMSWVASSLKISPVEQVAFLRKMLNRRLPVSANALDMTARIMPRVMLANGWEVHGKTGTASPVLPNGKDDEMHQYGWYVGWAKKGQRTVVFARLVLDRRQENSAAGPRAKAAFLSDLAGRLDTL